MALKSQILYFLNSILLKVCDLFNADAIYNNPPHENKLYEFAYQNLPLHIDWIKKFIGLSGIDPKQTPNISGLEQNVLLLNLGSLSKC